jgi:hypothetical protein
LEPGDRENIKKFVDIMKNSSRNSATDTISFDTQLSENGAKLLFVLAAGHGLNASIEKRDKSFFTVTIHMEPEVEDIPLSLEFPQCDEVIERLDVDTHSKSILKKYAKSICTELLPRCKINEGDIAKAFGSNQTSARLKNLTNAINTIIADKAITTGRALEVQSCMAVALFEEEEFGDLNKYYKPVRDVTIDMIKSIAPEYINRYNELS